MATSIDHLFMNQWHIRPTLWWCWWSALWCWWSAIILVHWCNSCADCWADSGAIEGAIDEAKKWCGSAPTPASGRTPTPDAAAAWRLAISAAGKGSAPTAAPSAEPIEARKRPAAIAACCACDAAKSGPRPPAPPTPTGDAAGPPSTPPPLPWTPTPFPWTPRSSMAVGVVAGAWLTATPPPPLLWTPPSACTWPPPARRRPLSVSAPSFIAAAATACFQEQ